MQSYEISVACALFSVIQGPYNARWMRHHQPVQLEMLYYPQAVTDENVRTSSGLTLCC